MRAVGYRTYGGPEVLEIVERPEPHAGPGEVRIAVRAASVNPIDWKLRSGAMAGDAAAPDELVVLGIDAAGVVQELGDGVDDVAIGDAVFGFAAGGATADHARLTAWAVKPEVVAFTEAAGWPVAVETAFRCLGLLALPSGATLVVNGASGGVGQAVLQLARARGLRVVGTASERNHGRLRELGAEATTYGDGMAERVRALAPDGVDGAIDTASSGGTEPLVELTGDPARVVAIANFAAAEHGVQVSTGGDQQREALAEAAALAADGRFSLPVEEVFEFARAADAHRASEAGHARGKLILVP